MSDATDIFSAQASNPIIANPIDPQPKWTYWAVEQTKLGRALKPKKAPLIVNTYSAFFASRRTAQPPDRLTHDIVEVAAHGGATVPALNGTFEQDDPRALGALGKLGDFLLENGLYYESLSTNARVALLYSPDSIQLGNDQGVPSGSPKMNGHIAEFRGCFEMLVQSRRPFDLLVCGALSKKELSRYDVVIAPAACCLSHAEVKLLDDYAYCGGMLIVTADTATIDECGNACEHIALRSVDCRIVQRINADGAYLQLDSSELASRFEGSSIMGLAGEFLQVEPTGDSCHDLSLHLIEPVKSNAPEFSDLAPASTHPGMLSGKYGDGWVNYLPWRIGALFYRCGLPDCFCLLEHLLERCVGSSPVVSDAPDSVEITCYTAANAPEGPACVLHFLNAATLQEKTLIKTIRLPGFDVMVDGHYSCARSLLTGNPLELTYRDGRSCFRLDSLGTFDVAVLTQ